MKPRLLVAVATALFATAAVASDAGRLPLWRVSGADNDVYLLASVHWLRATDYPLPAGIYAAYDDAETLVMELDMDDLDQADAAAIVAELGSIRNGPDLAAQLGAANYARAAELAESALLPLDAFSRNDLWLAAITIEQLLLTRIGFEPQLGIESHLMQRAVRDAKEIRGLETLREQLEILDELPLPVQRVLFMQTLEDSLSIEKDMNELIGAWQRGNMHVLESAVLPGLRKEPTLYSELVVNRNRNWSNQIASLLQDADDYLVIVGALHLVGEDGVPAMLKARGFKIRQLDERAMQ